MKLYSMKFLFLIGLFFSSAICDEAEERRYVQIKSSSANILEYLGPRAPVLGIARKGSSYPLISEGQRWCKIEYRGSKGWVEKQNVDIVSTPSSYLAKDAKGVLFFIIGAGAAILLGVLIMAVRRKLAGKKRSVYVQKSALVIAKESKSIKYILTDETVSLDKCFKEIGFTVLNAPNLKTAEKSISHAIPDLVLVDWQFSPTIQHDIERLFSQRPSTSNVYFLFYNVPDSLLPSASSKMLLNADFLGITFSDREIFKSVTPLIITSERTKKIRKSVETSALEGAIESGSLLEVFQFIEVGRKSGCLLIDTTSPYGLFYFRDGSIIYASTKDKQGKQAVFSVLNLNCGTFRFILNKRPKAANTAISTLQVLMEWTKEFDEANGN
ncbi:hypothetical protein CHISP_1421 [Chitinispirillum alkaliphilum]|nr:hypothetical protein CHISP_1421 [Chitinispirillum alkaliphilum]